MAVDANLGRKMVDDYNCKIIQQGPFMPLLPNETFEHMRITENKIQFSLSFIPTLLSSNISKTKQ